MKEEVTIIEATIPNDAVHVKKYVRGPDDDRIDKIGWWLMGICFAPFLLFGLSLTDGCLCNHYTLLPIHRLLLLAFLRTTWRHPGQADTATYSHPTS